MIPEYPVSFDYIFDQWDVEVVSKIGEGSFSEVFRVRPVDFSEKDVGAHEEYVFKVVPVGNHGQPKFEDLLPEMHMTLAGRYVMGLKPHWACYSKRGRSLIPFV